MKRLLLLPLILLTANSSQAIIIDISASRDVGINGNQINNNTGAGTFYVLSTVSQGRNGLLDFDLTSVIPSGARINSAELIITVTRNGGRNSGNGSVSLHSVLAPWGEGSNSSGSRGGAAGPNEVSWTSTGFSNWTSPGGDFSGVLSTSPAIPNSGTVTFSSTPDLVNEVQSKLDNPANQFGFGLVPTGDAVVAVRVGSREGGNASILRVDFTPIPEPSTALLMLGGALLFFRRSRA